MAKGNSKHRKNHKQKLQARKDKIQQDKNRMQKMQKEFIMNLILYYWVLCYKKV